MMIDKKVDRIFFLGIGGIGMSALAAYFLHLGYKVAGFDRTDSDICQMLKRAGADVFFNDSAEMIKHEWRNTNQVLVIYTPAIKQGALLNYFKEKGYTLSKRANMLGLIFNRYKGLAVAGTHGKTTTSAILSHILFVAGFPMAAFVGGVLKNYNANFLINANPEWVVAEADEFDRSFLQLEPKYAVITAADPDHLDIYENAENFKQAFIDFSGKVKEYLLVSNTLDRKMFKNSNLYTYGIEGNADYSAKNIKFDDSGYIFDIHFPDAQVWEAVKLGIFGIINVQNALAATILAIQAGVEQKDIREALATFSGIRRRFDIWFDNGKMALVDDYAHHPQEILALYKGLRHIFAGRKLVAIFQPHLYSRTRDFANEFADVLSLFDEQVVLPIYPAREMPIPGVESIMLVEKILGNNKRLMQKSEISAYLAEYNKTAVFVTIGAGDIDKELEKWCQILKNPTL